MLKTTNGFARGAKIIRLLACPSNFKLRVSGFAPRHLNRSVASLAKRSFVMITKIFRSVILFSICLLFTANISAQQFFNANELVGTYFEGDDYDFVRSGIELKADGTYLYGLHSCTYSTIQSGKFDISNGIIHFTILKYTGRKFSNRKKEINLLNTKARKKFYGDDDDEVESPETEFSLVPVKWDERTYLIFESDLKNFANAVNLGVEPRSETHSEIWFGSFFRREGDEQKSVSGKPMLPAEWQSYLLDEPVTAKITATEKQGEDNLGIIDRGSRDSLKVGMVLTGGNEEPSVFSREGIVVSVDERSAKILIFDLKVDDTISSRYIARNDHK